MKIVLLPSEIATVLVEALPYIRQFAGKSVVVKLGGAAIDRNSDLALAQDVLLLRSVGVRCVLVHGGGPQVDTMLRRVGKEPEFRDGLRVTDAETLEIVRMVLVGKINRDLVSIINSQAGDEPVAVGVSGEDAGLRIRRQRHGCSRGTDSPPSRRRPDSGDLYRRREPGRPTVQRERR
jgi:acetylglutamate kinase